MAAYAFARLNFPFKNAIFIFCLSLMMVPSQIFLIPQYDLMVKAGLNDTLIALILPRLFNVFSVFMLRQFFLTLPRELDDAAKIDGCGFFGIYYQILLPLLKPALVSVAILSGLSTWKDLLWPLSSIIPWKNNVTAVALLIGEHTQFNHPLWLEVFFGLANDSSVLPCSKTIVEGIAFSGIKGKRILER
jgi:multiple sugar transport system permease protein